MNEVWEIYQGAIRWKHAFKIQTLILCFKRFKKDSFLNLRCLYYTVSWELTGKQKEKEKERNSNLEMSSKLLHIMEHWMKFGKSIRVLSDGNILLKFKRTSYVLNVLNLSYLYYAVYGEICALQIISRYYSLIKTRSVN